VSVHMTRRPAAMRRLLTGSALPLLAALLATPAGAVEFKSGDIEGSFDTTLQAGVQARVQDRDCRLIGRVNGGCGGSVNGDDGNLNYDKGIVSSQVRATHELSLKYEDVGAFVRGTYFYDFENANGGRERTPLSSEAKELVGRDAELLDAYVYGDFEIADRSVGIRVGNQVLSWGESTFIPNGINTINPVNVAALRTPGSELRQAFLPVPIANVQVGITDGLSVEAFYQAKWKENRLEPVGSYFSTNDFAADGGDDVYLGFARADARTARANGVFQPTLPVTGVTDDGVNRVTGTTAALLAGRADITPLGSRVPRGPDNEPDDGGQFGFATRYFAEELNETEFGAYFINYHSRSPVISARTATLAQFQAGATTGAFANNSRYIVEYPEDIKLYGLSFNTTVAGISLQGEVSYRKDQPLQVDDVELLQAALAGPAVAAAAATAAAAPTGANIAALNQTVALFNTNQVVRSLGGISSSQVAANSFRNFFNRDISGYRLHDVLQAQATATSVFGPMIGADQWVLVGEAGFTHVRNMPDKSTLRYDGPGTSFGGNPNFLGVGGMDQVQASGDFADPFSWGYRLVARFDYNNAIAGINLQPSIAFSHDVGGTTPNPLATFVEGRKAVTLSLGATYLEQYAAELSYTSFFGAGGQNLLNDRDFVALSVKYSF